jgi:two-component system sensor histidine kinase KdpD
MSDVEARGSTLTKVIIRYSLSLVTVAVALLLRQALVQYLDAELPAFLFFYPSVMVVSLLGGLGPGLLATVFASLLADYWIFKPIGHFAIASPADSIALALFFGMGIFMSVVAKRQRTYHRRIEALKS